MKTSWWRARNELDSDQEAFIKLPATGRYALVGPPGSGKTNLLLLRAQFIAGSGERNVLIITFTNALANFIRTGIGEKGLIKPTQIKTFHSWAGSHISEYLETPFDSSHTEFDDESRERALAALKIINSSLPSKNLYSAIFVDEAQDLSIEELEQLLCLSPNVCICGDINQGIYQKDGLSAVEKLNLDKHILRRHFRIGQRIARVADRLCPPESPKESLEATSNYNPKTQGESSAEMHELDNRDEQFSKMVELIRVQMTAFPDDSIGVFCALRASLSDLYERFSRTDLFDNVVAHEAGKAEGFSSNKRIHLMTIHASKGTEFRAVHIFGAEELAKHPMNRTRISYTAVTRAKTALNAFRSGATSVKMDHAFAKPSHIDIDELFSENL